MASGDTKTEHFLDVLANGSRADIPTDNCCNTKTQNYILGAVNRMISLEEEVEELQNNPDVTDIVSTYQDLTNYDKTTLTDGDVIRVLTDSTHGDESAYYRYNAATDSFDYIGTTRAYTDFVGTSGGMAGAAGLVPAPQATDVDKYLKSDGTWATVSGGGGGTTNYNSMTNKPSINGVELIGNKSLEDLGISGVTEEQLDEAIDDETTAREAADTAINGRLDKNVSDLKSAVGYISNQDNLYDSSTAIEGSRINATGGLSLEANYFTSELISVTADIPYTKNSPVEDAYHRLAVYDYDGNWINGELYETNYVVMPSNAAFIRVCGLLTEKNTTVVNMQTAVDRISRADKVSKSDIINGLDETESGHVLDASQGNVLKRRIFPVTAISPNLHNLDTDHDGYYFNNGSYIENPNYNATDRIPVDIGKTYYFSNDGVTVKARYVAFYSLAGYYQYGSDVQRVNSVTIGNNIGSIVVSYDVTYTKFQIEPDAITKYLAFDAPYILADAVDGIDALKNKNLRTNHPLYTVDYPTSLRTGYKVIFSANITNEFTAFTIQRGAHFSQIEQITVGMTALRYNCGGTVLSVDSHGLTWKDKCDVIIESIDLAHTKITLVTNGGIFSHTFDRPKGFGNNGAWSSTDTMGGTLVQQISKPNDIWIIGDSYMSYDDARVSGALYEIGQTTPTILSIPGATTDTMADQFIKMIDCYHVIPSTVCVCTGMNDDTASAYQTGLNKILQYANKFGIDVIVTVVPITPARTSYNTAVDNYIMSLDYPKIRFDQAVGSNASGEWYDGCINQDNLHPSQAGARLLATEILRVIGYLCK